MATLVRRIGALDRERQAAMATAAVYGTVISLAALAGVSVSNIAHGIGFELVVGVGFATWIAHVFAELVGEQLLHAHAPEERDLARALVDSTPVLIAAIPPAAMVGLGQFEALDDQLALWLGVVVGILQLFAICFAVGSISGDRRDTWRYGVAATLVGVFVVVIKITLGHH
jgi:hypothetical protein